jgi:hypothetical protein
METAKVDAGAISINKKEGIGQQCEHVVLNGHPPPKHHIPLLYKASEQGTCLVPMTTSSCTGTT